MELKGITPDEIVFWQWGFVRISATLVFTWGVMALLAVGSWLITRRLKSGADISRWQNLLEIIVDFIRKQIRQISREEPDRYLPFIGTLLLFIAVSNALGVVPGYLPPTASLSTTTALALCVLVAVPTFGVSQEGLKAFLKHYVSPSPFMFPFHLIGELSRTLALAVRLFGNVLSGTKIVTILVALTPLIFPLVMHLLGLLTGLIQAYIFALLAMVYIASGVEAYRERSDRPEPPEMEQDRAVPTEGKAANERSAS